MVFGLFKSKQTLSKEKEILDQKIRSARKKANKRKEKAELLNSIVKKKAKLKELKNKYSGWSEKKERIKGDFTKIKKVASSLGKVADTLGKASIKASQYKPGNYPKKKKKEDLNFKLW